MMEFLKHVETECVKKNVRLVLSPDPYVYTMKDAARCRGFYDEDGTLAVATGAVDWPGILAHEFGHFEQYNEGLFNADSLSFEPYGVLEEWYAGKKHSEKKIGKAFDWVMECELDAERRAVGYISRYQLVSDLGAYIARANGYIVSHLWARKHRQWPHLPIDWKGLSAKQLVPNNRIWNRDEVVLTPELEAEINAAQKKVVDGQPKV